MAKFRLRNLLGRVPFLDGLRISALITFCKHGISFFGSSYPTIKLFSPGAKLHLADGKAALFAVQHGRMIGMLQMLEDRSRVSILISQSRDGKIIAQTMQDLGYAVARGSAKEGAVKGGLQMAKAAEAGQHLVLMVDGPRGPAYEVKSGVIKMAEMTGLPIIPFTASSRHSMKMWGWDSFMATHWGSPILHLYGDPIIIAKDLTDSDRESLRLQLERQLETLRTAGDRYWSVMT